MKQSIIRGSGLARFPGSTPTWGAMRGECAACFASLALAMLPGIAFAQPCLACPGIHVKVLNIRNSTGAVACALFESPRGFPTDFMHVAINIVVIKVRDTQAQCDFEDIAPGKYSLGVIHDENMNAGRRCISKHRHGAGVR